MIEIGPNLSGALVILFAVLLVVGVRYLASRRGGRSGLLGR